MIIEQEIIEQITDDERSLAWCANFIKDFGKEPWSVLGPMISQGMLIPHDTKGTRLPDWKVKEVVRNREASDEVILVPTDDAIKWAFGG